MCVFKSCCDACACLRFVFGGMCLSVCGGMCLSVLRDKRFRYGDVHRKTRKSSCVAPWVGNKSHVENRRVYIVENKRNWLDPLGNKFPIVEAGWSAKLSKKTNWLGNVIPKAFVGNGPKPIRSFHET